MAKRKSNLKELEKAIKTLEPAKMELGLKLIEQLQFMEETLIEFQNRVKTDGAIIEAVNGNGFTVKSEHPASKAYSTLIGKYNAMSKSVADLLPVDAGDSDELLQFLGRGTK